MPKNPSEDFFDWEENEDLKNAFGVGSDPSDELDFLSFFRGGNTTEPVQDDLDLESFLNLTEDSPEEQPPMKRSEIRALAEETPADEPAAAEAEMPATPKKKKARAARKQSAPEPPLAEPVVFEQSVPEQPEMSAETEAAPEETDAFEEEERRPLMSRFVRRRSVQEDDAPLEEDTPKKRSVWQNLKDLLAPMEDEASEEAQKEEIQEPEKVREGGREPLKGIVSFFSRSTPEKEKFDDLMATSKDEETPETEKNNLTLRGQNRPAVSVRQSLAREPELNEMLVYDSELDAIDLVDDEDLPEMRDYLPIRFRRYSNSGIGGGLMYAIFVISLSVVLACAGWMFAADVLALSKDYTEAVVIVEPYIPTGEEELNEDGEPVDEEGRVYTCNIDQVASALHDGGIIDFEFLFKAFSKISHAYSKIDPGTYDVSTSLDYRALVTEMQTGSDSQEITRITFPEGFSMDQIFAKLEENGICDAEDLYEAAAEHEYDYSWLEGVPLGEATRLEGYLFPDTYDFYQGENAVNVINRFLLRFHSILTADMYQQADNLGISLRDALIVASLIEKEAGPEDDRGNFASVIYNRLYSGWKLQLDSTINYINNTSTFNISYADLETDSPYNTYLYEGLPAGPICSPGLASLNAALNPNSTNYWYWYAYDNVTYFFSDSGDFNNFAAEHPY